jgi:hypothetical protein
MVARETVLAGQGGVEHGRVVAAEDDWNAGGEQVWKWMLGQARDNPRGDVARQADLQGDVRVAQPVEQPRVVDSCDPVADPLGSEGLDSGPDLVGPDACQPSRNSLFEAFVRQVIP